MKRFYIPGIAVLVVILSGLTLHSFAQSTTFIYSAGVQTFSVSGSAVSVDMTGGLGGSYPGESVGGGGGRVLCTLNVTPGQTYYVYVGQVGANGPATPVPPGGLDGGGGATGGAGSTSNGGAAGGAATDIRSVAYTSGTATASLNSRLVVAGGGGGGGYDCGGETGGAGGNTTGGGGIWCGTTETNGGGTGSGGVGNYTTGAFGAGGDAAPSVYGGGGGGGWWGGGGAEDGGGGGGSSYVAPGLTSNVTYYQGYNTLGSGLAVVTVLCNGTGTISGNVPVCQGNSFTLSDATAISGGTWSSSNTTVASVNASSGVVTGVLHGTATITYTVPNPCGALATAVVTINALPAAIGGTPSVCIGAITTLSETTTGGIWTSSNPSAATVDGSGNVSGAAPGSTGIVYTLPTTCASSTTVAVNSAPGPILGTASVCVGSTTLLTDVVGGGTWSSTSGTIAGVTGTGSSAIASGTSTGTSNILYTLSTGCSSSVLVTVNALPTQFIVTTIGTPTYCTGSTNTASVDITGSTVGVSYQLFNGAVSTGSPVAGTGALLSFGVPTSPGTYTVTGSSGLTGCARSMLLSATIAPKPLPTQYAVTGGGPICSGGSVPDSLNGSVSGVSYKLINGSDTLETITGTGFPLSFGPQSLPGTYTVVAYSGGTPNCSNNMISSASITVNIPPNAYNITGGGTYCAGADGLAIGLDFSNTGVSYQLYNGSSTDGLPVAGTGSSISFGLQAIPGSGYEVIATNIATSCVSNMLGFASISIASLPPAHNIIVAGDPTGCVGSSSPDISLDGSDGGVNYQLYNDGIPVGSPVIGSGFPVDFGTFTDSGTYTVVATDQTYFCTNTMTGSAVINLSPLPAIHNVTGGGSFCEFGTGVSVMLDGSDVGISYQLYYNGVPFGGAVPGTGGSLNFNGLILPGVYTISAGNPFTGCTSNMAGSAVISVNPLPLPFNVTGGGSYCASGVGVDVGLGFSAVGVNYQLYFDGAPVGATIGGTGDSLDFGYHTPFGTYSIVGKNPTTGCVANMSGNAIITINALPNLHSVSGGGSYCSGGTGDSVNLNGSDEDITYQLYNGVTPIGSPVAGTGTPISFGLQTLNGTYTVVATNTLTQCTKNMSGVATVVVNAIPSAYNVTGGGIFCAGSPGAHIGLMGSNGGVHYFLYNSGSLVSTVTGTGSSIDFGLETSVGTYTVTATNVATGCTNSMTGDAVIATNTAPTAYPVIGGGSYCTGSSAIPSVGLGGSDAGVSYQLYHGSAAIGAAAGGTGAPLDLGTQSAAGSYTVVATNLATGCTINMPGSASVAINPLPSVYTVTGGGNYCAGSDGYHVYMSITNPGISYILYQGPTIIDTVMGTGAGVDFGLQATSGLYTAIAINPATGCKSNMTGSAVIVINPLPAVHTVTVADGGNYCVTGSGVAVGLDGSNSGVNYQLYNGLTTVGASIGGSGSAVNFGIHTAGNYTIVATNEVTGCKNNMTGSAMVNAIPLPNAYTTTGGGNYCTTGLGLHVGISSSDSGTQYQLYYAATPTGIAGPTPFSFPIVGTGGAVDFGLFIGAGTYTVIGVNGGSLGCDNHMSGAAVIAVYPVIIPTVSMGAMGGDTGCAGVTSHFAAVAVNGGPSPVYNWSVNGVAAPAAGSSYSYIPANGDIVTVVLHSNAICAVPDTVSRTITMAVSIPEAPSVNITASPGAKVCQGSPVTFTGTSMFGGSSPAFTWVKNSIYVVGTGPTYTYTPSNNDVIVLLMGSDFPCRLLDSVFSNTITMEMDAPVSPDVTIYAVPGTQIMTDQSVTFTALATNGSATPTYQWFINGVAVTGATNVSFTSTHLTDNDSVECEVAGGCSATGSSYVIMHVGTEGVQHVTGAGTDKVKLVPNPNNGIFILKGALESTGDEEVSIEVINMLGQVVYSSKIVAQNGNINENIKLSSSLANGMYILNLRSGTQNNVFHFVVEE